MRGTSSRGMTGGNVTAPRGGLIKKYLLWQLETGKPEGAFRPGYLGGGKRSFGMVAPFIEIGKSGRRNDECF